MATAVDTGVHCDVPDISDDFAIALALQEEENASSGYNPVGIEFNYSHYDQEQHHDDGEYGEDEEYDYSDLEGEYEDSLHAAMYTHAGVSLHDDEDHDRIRRMVIHESMFDRALQAEQAHLHKGVAINRNSSVSKPAKPASSTTESPQRAAKARRRRSEILNQVEENRARGKEMVCLTLRRNANQQELRTLRVPKESISTLKDFLKKASIRFRRSGKQKFVRAFTVDGTEVVDPATLHPHAEILLSCGEEFVGK